MFTYKFTHIVTIYTHTYFYRYACTNRHTCTYRHACCIVHDILFILFSCYVQRCKNKNSPCESYHYLALENTKALKDIAV